MFVVVLCVLGHDLPEVLFAVDQEVVKALAPQRSHVRLREGVGQRLCRALGAHIPGRGHRPDADRRATAPARDPGRIRLGTTTSIACKDGTITAGTASQISDGAAVVVVMSAEAAERAGVRALAEIGTHGNVAGPDNSLHSPAVQRHPAGPGQGRADGIRPGSDRGQRRLRDRRLPVHA